MRFCAWQEPPCLRRCAVACQTLDLQEHREAAIAVYQTDRYRGLAVPGRSCKHPET
jgi:hypothetical protein